MSLSNLYNQLNGKTAIELSSTDLGSDGDILYPLLHNLSNTAIVIAVSQGPTWDSAANTSFTVEGTVAASMLGVNAAQVQFNAFEADGDIHFTLRYSTPNDWTLGQGFFAVANTELEQLPFGGATVVLTTKDAATLKRGLNLQKSLELSGTGILSSIQELVPGAATAFQMSGHLEAEEEVRILVLKGQITSAKAGFDILDLLHFEFDAPALGISAYMYDNGNPAFVTKRIEGSVALRAAGGGDTVELPLALQLPTAVSGWQFMMQPYSHKTLDDFVTFLTLLGSAGKVDFNGLLSGDLEPIKSLLSSLRVNTLGVELIGGLDTSPRFRLFFVGIEQVVGDSWTIIEDVIDIENLHISLRTAAAGTGYTTNGLVRGNLKINDSLSLVCSVPIPINSGDWRVVSQHSVPLTDLDIFKKFTGGQSIAELLPESLRNALENFSLQKLELLFTPTSGIHRFTIGISMDSPWKIIEDRFELDSLYMEFTLANNNGTWGLYGDIHAELLAGGIRIESNVTKEDPQDDWRFGLHANRVTLPSLGDLSRLTGSETALSDTFPSGVLNSHLLLNEPRIGFNLTSLTLESFGFDLETEEIQLGDFKLLQAGVDVDIYFGSNRSIKVYGKFTVSEIDFYGEASYEDSNGWQFTGRVATEHPIEFDTLIENMAAHFGIVVTPPESLKGVQLYNIMMDFNTKSKDFHFGIDATIEVGTKKILSHVAVDFTHNEDSYTHKFSGTIRLDDMEFDLLFNQSTNTNSIFLAAYENTSGKSQSIAPLVSLITDDPVTIGYAEDLTFDLKDVLFVIDTTELKFLFGLDIGGGIDISNLPLIGKMFPDGAKLQMTLKPLIASEIFEDGEMRDIKPLVPQGGYDLPDKKVDKGIDLKMELLIGDQVIDLNFPIGRDSSGKVVKDQLPGNGTTSTTNAPAPAPATSDSIKWFQVQKQLGPVHFGRVGVQFEDSRLFFFLDASLSLGGLTVSVDGLYASTTLKPIHPQFGLHGLGIDYKKDPLEIGGAFLRQTFNDPSGKPYDTYDGAAIIRTKKFGLSALGSYAYYQGHPSLFIYAFLDVPLGGPSFFFVTGLAAGFGYNRRVIAPSLEKVKNFPLIQQAVNGAPDTTGGLTTVISELHEVIPPAIGENFFAVGIRFSSFEIIDSFALLILQFGDEFEIDVLGLSTLVIPTPALGESSEALAEIQMGLKAVFSPKKGYLKVQAGLTSNSFILSRNCHLTGGFAFFTWFEDNVDSALPGEFVLSLGGYHPKFKPKSYYPKVAPLGFNWNVGYGLEVKGDFYFALVPTAVMAGGHLSATWHSGHIKAWFNVGADFIISWKPYFYKADMHVDMGVSYTYHFFGTHHISVHLGADLHIWGPDFSGKAHVHLWIVTFNVTFGAGSSKRPKKLSWDSFRESFLPDRKKWNTVNVTGGLVKEVKTDELPLTIIDPKNFKVETDAAIPFNASNNVDTLKSKHINIGSMEITSGLTTTHDVVIRKGPHTTDEDVTSNFTFKKRTKNVPKALWGSDFVVDINSVKGDQMIEGAYTGLEITGDPVVASNDKVTVSTENLLNENVNLGTTTDPGLPAKRPQRKWLSDAGVRTSAVTDIEQKAAKRNTLIGALGIEGTYMPNGELVNELVLTEA